MCVLVLRSVSWHWREGMGLRGPCFWAAVNSDLLVHAGFFRRQSFHVKAWPLAHCCAGLFVKITRFEKGMASGIVHFSIKLRYPS